LPARACPQISIPLKPSIPRTSKAKTALNVPSTSPSAPDGFFGRIGSRFRRDKYTPKTIEMQPPSPKIPKYSPVGKVALGQADARLYRAKSKERKPSGDESGQEEWADVEHWSEAIQLYLKYIDMKGLYGGIISLRISNTMRRYCCLGRRRVNQVCCLREMNQTNATSAIAMHQFFSAGIW
ncbi:hypothetical protein BJ138DRAFT_1100716, partial [Hygrophoropsis aurantiaca]